MKSLPGGWQPHLNSLVKTVLLHRKIELHSTIHSLKVQTITQNLYHTLFESYFLYAVSVWGGAKLSKLKPVFKAQKKAIHVKFGDREKYIDKFKTGSSPNRN